MAVVGRVHRLSLAVAGRVERHFHAHGISRGNYDVLASLRRAGDPPALTPGQLREALLLSSAGVTGRVDRLERARLVRRHPHPQDGRGVVVELTPDGRRLVDRLVRRHPHPQDGRGVVMELTPDGRRLVDRLVREDMERQAAWLAAPSPADRERLAGLLDRLLDAVEADGADRAGGS